MNSFVKHTLSCVLFAAFAFIALFTAGEFNKPLLEESKTSVKPSVIHSNELLKIPARFMAPGVVDAQSTQPLGPYGNLSWSTQVTATNTATVRALDMTTMLTGTPTVNTTYTTDNATNLCGLFPFVAAQNAYGFTWDWYLKNTAASSLTITLGAGTGVTIVGTGTVAQNDIRHFKINISGCSGTPAATIYSLEQTAF